MHTTNKGVTLIEAIAVIIILLILGAAATIRFSAYDTIKLNAAAQRIADDIRYVQMLAMTKPALDSNGKRGGYLMYFSPGSSSFYVVYAIQLSADGILEENLGLIDDPWTKEDFWVDFESGSYSGITIQTASFGGPGVVIFYEALGRPYRTMGFDAQVQAIANAGQIAISYKNLPWHYICVEPETGIVSIRTDPCP